MNAGREKTPAFLVATLAVPLLAAPAFATNYSGMPELLGGSLGGFLLALAASLAYWALKRSRSWTDWLIWAGAAVSGLAGAILLAFGGFLLGKSAVDALCSALVGAGFASLLAAAAWGIRRLFAPRSAPVSLGEAGSPVRVVKLVFFTLLGCFAAVIAIVFAILR